MPDPIPNAIASGQREADSIFDLRKKELEERTQAVSQELPPGREAPQVPEEARAILGPSASRVIIAEGDSWFDYPFFDILSELEKRHGIDVESVAHMGDRVEDMAYANGQLHKFSRVLEKVLRRGVVPSAILLSGGGNDVTGERLAIILNHAASQEPGLNDDILKGLIHERLKLAYVKLISTVTAICRRWIGEEVRIIIHGYDHPVPDGRGILIWGPWLEPGFRAKGYVDLDQSTKLIGSLIDEFNKMLDTVAGLPGHEHVKYVDLRGTLKTDDSYQEWWGNELHPTRAGFTVVASKIANVIP